MVKKCIIKTKPLKIKLIETAKIEVSTIHLKPKKVKLNLKRR